MSEYQMPFDWWRIDALQTLAAATWLIAGGNRQFFFVRRIVCCNMFDLSLSMSVIFPRVQLCQEAYISNEKCSWRIENAKSTRLWPRQTTNIMKQKQDTQNQICSTNEKPTNQINTRFSPSSTAVFCSYNIHMAAIHFSNIWKLETSSEIGAVNAGFSVSNNSNLCFRAPYERNKKFEKEKTD